jgi:hypothetical protein
MDAYTQACLANSALTITSVYKWAANNEVVAGNVAIIANVPTINGANIASNINFYSTVFTTELPPFDNGWLAYWDKFTSDGNVTFPS